VLDLAADPEQMGVVSRQADDIPISFAGQRDQEVAIGDTA
jgi:hypothetical protein